MAIDTTPETASSASGEDTLSELFSVGAHYTHTRSKRHPSAKQYIFGVKNKIEIFDLEKTEDQFEKAKKFATQLGEEGKLLLFVSSKMEAKNSIEKEAEAIGMPYVSGRWIGGALTNFTQIRSRIEKLEKLEKQQETGEFAKYTKKERLLLEREIEDLRERFSGLRTLTRTPDAIYIIDTKKEHVVFDEARQLGIPVISLSGSDCDHSVIQYPIPANDTSKDSIAFFTSAIARAYAQGTEKRALTVEKEEKTEAAK